GTPKMSYSPRRHLAVLGVTIVLVATGTLYLWAKRGSTPVPPPVFENEACRTRYLSFYEKPQIDLKVVFGYKDARPARFVADRYERAIFIQRLLRDCKHGNQACGFRRGDSDADLFLKDITGPDGKPRSIYL